MYKCGGVPFENNSDNKNETNKVLVYKTCQTDNNLNNAVTVENESKGVPRGEKDKEDHRCCIIF